MSIKRWINFYFASTVRLTDRRLYFQAFVICCCLLVVLGAASADLLELGEAPRFPEDISGLPTLGPQERILSGSAGLSVDPTSRSASRDFFNTNYKASEGYVIGWTGNDATCDAGTTAVDFQNAVLLRVNYFRAMAGVPSGTVFSDTYSGKDQDAAFMMSVNGALSHSPPTSWTCYSADGAEAAGKSNLSLGVSGWHAISLYMEDPGSSNNPAGHRRWILYPQTQTMGTGDVPSMSGYWASNALWVFDSNLFGPRPSTRDGFVSWPPPGYVPYPVVFPRWSFSYPFADFSAATVTMSSEGTNIPVDVAPIANGYGENTIVWIPNHMNDGDVWPKPSEDTVFSITVGNVVINGTPQEFQYEVTVFDPDRENTVFVATDNYCSGNTPCSLSIQSGIALAFASATIEVTGEIYSENVNLNSDVEIALRGGWDSSFTSNSSFTTIQGSITITNGTMIIGNIILQ